MFFGLLTGVFLLLLEAVLSLVIGSGFRVAGGRVVFEPTPFLVATLIEAVVSAVLLPLTVIGMTILYFDLRFRHGEPPHETSVAGAAGASVGEASVSK